MELWPEAVRCAAYISNRTLTKRTHHSMKTRTPYEIITGLKPYLGHLKIYGCQVKVKKFDKFRRGKFDEKAWDGFLVGYFNDNFYRIYIPERNTFVISQDVVFFEKTIETDQSSAVTPQTQTDMLSGYENRQQEDIHETHVIDLSQNESFCEDNNSNKEQNRETASDIKSNTYKSRYSREVRRAHFFAQIVY